ncbi:MAG: hypothetical protein KDA45_01750 [Planctomycetales bacterium]|nr:hypothetical protein [Planctomycetales bacterium]
MRTISRILGCGLCVATLAAFAAAQDTRPSQSPEKQPQTDNVPQVSAERPMSFWMQKKLDYSKSLLESLTKADFERLVEDAEHMRVLGRIEGFVRRKNPDYRAQLRTFELANQELIRQGKRGNSEGATLAFNQLTTSCVACHALLREGIE